jgi:hypothetical protein
MKITTTKIIREIEKKGYVIGTYPSELIRDTLYIIDEILKEKKGITIKK